MSSFGARRRLLADLKFWFAILALLVIIGLIFVYSASSVYALENFGSSFYFVRKQAIYLGLGLVLMALVGLLPLSFIKILTPWFFLVTIGMTGLTLVPQLAVKIHGSHRWLHWAGYSFQPSELLKWAVLLYIGYLLAKNWHERPAGLKSFVPICVVTGVTAVLLLYQPDFGMAVVLGVTVFLLLFVARFKLKHLLGIAGLALPVIIYLVTTKAYRWQRILIFLNPWQDPQGAGFQVIQSLIAIGSGGGWGTGISHSKQKFFYLPMQHTDFIFSIIAEETGFVGSVAIVFLFLLFAYQGTRLLLQFKDPFAVFAIFSFLTFNSLQALVNLSVSTGLFPTKGIGLPFISYGGTALLANCLMAGVILSCGRDYRTN